MIDNNTKHTLHLMNLMEINQIECNFEEVKPYQLGTKRKTFTFNEWIKQIVFKYRVRKYHETVSNSVKAGEKPLF